MALLAFTFSLKAQQYVSTQPSNRNVILEEFTGRTCTWCPSGHVIANGIKAAHPDQFWSINIHSNGYFSATTYPNLNTEKGNQIRAAFNAQSTPPNRMERASAWVCRNKSWCDITATSSLNRATATWPFSLCCLSDCNLCVFYCRMLFSCVFLYLIHLPFLIINPLNN